MKQGLSDWASVAEIASGVVVVVTFVVLIIGVQENTDAIRASTYSQSLDSLNQWRNSISESRELAGYWNAFRTGEVNEFDDLEFVRFGQFVITLITIYEHSYFSWRRC